MLSLLTAAGWVLAGTAPRWWRQFGPESGAVARAALRFENTATSALSRVRPRAQGLGHEEGYRSDPWVLELRDDEVSAWLTARLPAWLNEHEDLPEWPDAFSQMQVHFEPGILRLGVRYSDDRSRAVMSAALRPGVRPDGSVWLAPAGVSLGRLPLPQGLVIDHAKRHADSVVPRGLASEPELLGFFDAISGRIAAAEEPVIVLPDGRQVRVLDVRLSRGRIEVLCQTEARGAAFAARSP